MKSPVTVELRITANPENIALARLALTGVATVAGASPDETADLKLAVSEICTNAVRHAYPQPNDEDVLLRYTVNGASLNVEVIDTGIGFHESPRELDLPGAAQQSLGLGIVRATMDSLAIESGAAGSRVVFTKTLRHLSLEL
jgi:serine/threonine-protein kinase RsbW